MNYTETDHIKLLLQATDSCFIFHRTADNVVAHSLLPTSSKNKKAQLIEM